MLRTCPGRVRCTHAQARTPAAANVSFFGLNPNADREINQAAWKGALIGGALGAGIGAGIGAGSNHWILIYRRW